MNPNSTKPSAGKAGVEEILEYVFMDFYDPKDHKLREIPRFENKLRNYIASELAREIDKYKDALIWCSGSEDFQVTGKARAGWEKICIPLLTEAAKKVRNYEENK